MINDVAGTLYFSSNGIPYFRKPFYPSSKVNITLFLGSDISPFV